MHFWNTIWMYFIQYEWCTCTLWDHITRKLSVSLIMFVNFSLNAITRHHFNRFKLMRFALKMFRHFFHWNICVDSQTVLKCASWNGTVNHLFKKKRMQRVFVQAFRSYRFILHLIFFLFKSQTKWARILKRYHLRLWKHNSPVLCRNSWVFFS